MTDLHEENNRLRAELASMDGRRHIAEKFHDLMMKERDLERLRVDRLSAELAMVKAKLDSALQAVEDQRLEKEIAEHALARATKAMPTDDEWADLSDVVDGDADLPANGWMYRHSAYRAARATPSDPDARRTVAVKGGECAACEALGRHPGCAVCNGTGKGGEHGE